MLLWKSFKFNLMVCSKSNINLIKQIHDVVRLFSNWSQVTLKKSREKKKVAHAAQPSESLMQLILQTR